MEWISIKNQLPEKGKPVLIYEGPADQGIMAVSYWDGTYSKMRGHDPLPQFPDGQDEQPSHYWPSHWMPLPEPPKND